MSVHADKDAKAITACMNLMHQGNDGNSSILLLDIPGMVDAAVLPTDCLAALRAAQAEEPESSVGRLC